MILNHRVFRDLEPLCWYHSESGGLTSARSKAATPVVPIVLDPEYIRKNCPAVHRYKLERYLSRLALSYAHRYANMNDFNMVSELLNRHPLMKKYRWGYFKLRVKMGLPALIPLVRRTKGAKHV